MKLEEHTLKQIKQKLALVLNAVKIPRYSKMTKPQLIKAIREHPAIEVMEKEGREVGLKVNRNLLGKTHKMPDGKVMTGAKHTADSKPVKSNIEKPKPKKLTERIKEFNKKYNTNEIKKQKLDKSNLKKYTDPYFKELEEIEKILSDIDDPMEFFRNNKELSSTFTDIKKNFIRRVKSNMKKTKTKAKPVKKMVKADSKVGKAILAKTAKDKKAMERRAKARAKVAEVSYKKPKKERTPAQKAATARMLEANKKRREKK